MQYSQRRAVITGIGLVSANGFDLNTFWNNLTSGNSGASLIDRLDTTGLPSKVACPVRGFAPAEHLSSGSANGYALVTQYAVAAARKAMEDAACRPEDAPYPRCAVVASAPAGNSNPLPRRLENLGGTSPDARDALAVLNARMEGGAAAITLELGLRAHTMTLSSGCSHGSETIGEALNLVRNDDADLVLAGAADTPITPELWGIFSASGLMSRESEYPAQAMKPFARGRDGFILGEGAAFFVIEELSAARARGARIYAEILGHARAMDAPASPQSPRQRFDSLGTVLRKCEVALNEVDYLNAHGAATAQDDVDEARAIKHCFGNFAHALQVSATKPVTGHLAGAAGALETAICALAIQRHKIPPTLNLNEADPACDLDFVPTTGRDFPVRVAVNLNAGFGQHNSCLVLRALK